MPLPRALQRAALQKRSSLMQNKPAAKPEEMNYLEDRLFYHLSQDYHGEQTEILICSALKSCFSTEIEVKKS